MKKGSTWTTRGGTAPPSSGCSSVFHSSFVLDFVQRKEHTNVRSQNKQT